VGATLEALPILRMRTRPPVPPHTLRMQHRLRLRGHPLWSFATRSFPLVRVSPSGGPYEFLRVVSNVRSGPKTRQSDLPPIHFSAVPCFSKVPVFTLIFSFVDCASQTSYPPPCLILPDSPRACATCFEIDLQKLSFLALRRAVSIDSQFLAVFGQVTIAVFFFFMKIW